MLTKKGFTLIELLVVIAIIAVLMGILIPSLGRAREHAKRVICTSNLKSIGAGLVMYAQSADNKLPENPSPREPYFAYRADKNKYRDNPKGKTAVKLGLLYETKIIGDPKVFYCPSNRVERFLFESYSNPLPWGSLPQEYNTGINECVRTGFSYYPQSKKMGADGLPKLATTILDLDSRKTMVTDLIWDYGQLSHVMGDKPAGLNALFGDGHVRFSVSAAAFDPDLWKDTVIPGSREFREIVDLLRP